jgi:CheY-like chemotaxis protein
MDSTFKKISSASLSTGWPSVLILEDDGLQQKLYKLIAEQVQMRPTIVSDCAEAIRLAAENDYELIVMDLQMPDESGVDCAQRMRQLPRVSGNSTPIIAITAHAMPGDRERCLAAGMDDYLSKPFTLVDLREKVATWTGRIVSG